MDPSNNTATDFASGISNPVDLAVASDGSLYYLARGSSSVFRVRFTGGTAPNITTHPANQTVAQGSPATFSVVASGSTPLGYQWQRNQQNIPNATSAAYTISSASMPDNGAKFRCVVTNAFGSATSNEATLTVQPPPPILLTEQGSDSAIALASPTWFRDPFPLTDPFNLSSDNRTRLMLFGINLSSAVTAQAEDASLNVYLLPIEFVGNVPNFEGLTQVIVILPGNLPSGQDVFVSVTLGQTSNKVRIRIQ